MDLRHPTIIYHDEVQDIKTSVVGVLKGSREETDPRSGLTTPQTKSIVAKIVN